jgi:ribosome maturation protein Sdo1
VTEEQLQALADLMQTIAYNAVGNAIHQPRPKNIIENAMDRARMAFNLSINEEGAEEQFEETIREDIRVFERHP